MNTWQLVLVIIGALCLAALGADLIGIALDARRYRNRASTKALRDLPHSWHVVPPRPYDWSEHERGDDE